MLDAVVQDETRYCWRVQLLHARQTTSEDAVAFTAANCAVVQRDWLRQTRSDVRVADISSYWKLSWQGDVRLRQRGELVGVPGAVRYVDVGQSDSLQAVSLVSEHGEEMYELALQVVQLVHEASDVGDGVVDWYWSARHCVTFRQILFEVAVGAVD